MLGGDAPPPYDDEEEDEEPVPMMEMEDAEEAEAMFRRNKKHPKWDSVTKWVVVVDQGISWRSDTKFSKKSAGKGPVSGDEFVSVGGPRLGKKETFGHAYREMWYVKIQVSK